MANALRAGGRRHAHRIVGERAAPGGGRGARPRSASRHDPEAEGPPWFWSDQYDDNLQLLGVPDERMRVVERSVPEKRQRVFFFCEGAQVRAVAAINGGREIKVARKWMLQDRFPPSTRSPIQRRSEQAAAGRAPLR